MTSIKDRQSGDGNHAIIIGGSMAGLLAARVLADHFEQVTIIESDRFPEQPVPRKGVPQSAHLHVLLTRGRMIIEQLFPGLQDELIATGAPVLDMGKDMAWLNPAGWSIRFQSGFNILAFSRDLLDWKIRRRLSAFSNVRFLEECKVTQLLSNSDATSVTGVSVIHNASAQSKQEELFADLVVDASGRGSKAPQWLKALGYQPPVETVVDASPGYASRIYEIPSGFQADWKGVYIQASPPFRNRGGVLYPIEGNRWIVSLNGMMADYPPSDEAGFLEFVRSLPSPMIYDAIKDAKPFSPISSYHAPGNRLRHYEQTRQPEGFVVVGDAVCTFNPVYGQGMTIAALGAITLDQCLRQLHQQGNRSLAERFQKRLSHINSLPWLLATSQDSRYPKAKGKTPSYIEKLMQSYLDRVTQLTTNNTSVCLVMFEVIHMLKPITALFQPNIVFQVLKQALMSSPSEATSSQSPQYSKVNLEG